MKQLKRQALGMNRQNVDFVEDEFFNLGQLKGVSLDELEELRNVDLDEVSGEQFELSDSDQQLADDDDSDDEDYDAVLEKQMDFLYNEFKARRARMEGQPKEPSQGKKLTRRQRMEIDARAQEDAALAKLDNEHQKYLRLLAGVKEKALGELSGDERGSGSDTESSGASSDGSDDESSSDEEDAKAPLLVDNIDGEDEAPDPQLRAKRWFSRGIFDEVNVEAQMVNLPAAEESETEESEEEEEEVSASAAALQSDSDDDKEPEILRLLDALPKSERERRKDRLKKQREQKKKQEEKARKKDEGLQIVPAINSDDEEAAASAAKADDATNALTERQLRRRELIRAGMGAALTAEDSSAAGAPNSRKRKREDDDDGFEVVTAADEGSDDVSSTASSADPRLEEYDSDEHAEILALGKLMKKHTRAKELVDARLGLVDRIYSL